MSERFQGLTKIPNQPAARLLANANTKLGTAVTAPPTAPVEAVLAELDAAGAPVDLLLLMAVALPPRERVWWACLAARDLVGPEAEPVPRPLAAAEAWVYRPGDETREEVRKAIETVEVDDDTVHCARAALLAAGTLGPGELDEFEAPPGGSESAAFAMNVVALGERSDDFEAYAARLVDRALDIARGGNGKLAEAAAP